MADEPKPEYFKPIDLCPKCLHHYAAEPFLIEACASVGIEHGKSAGRMLKDYFEVYHQSNHRVPPQKKTTATRKRMPKNS